MGIAPVLTIIKADPTWAQKYCDFCQPIYQKAYAAPELGIPAELFSVEAFNHPSTRAYFDKVFTEETVWLALDGDDILGGIAVSSTDPVHLSAFYVRNDMHGKGIGKQLFVKAVEFAGGRDIILDVMQHRHESIALYKHWGFVVDTLVPLRFYNWAYPTPQGRKNGAGVTMRRKANTH